VTVAPIRVPDEWDDNGMSVKTVRWRIARGDLPACGTAALRRPEPTGGVSLRLRGSAVSHSHLVLAMLRPAPKSPTPRSFLTADVIPLPLGRLRRRGG
jgi:hypothetical protein